MNGQKEYYEKYWVRENDVSENDVTTSERKNHLLRNTANAATKFWIWDVGGGSSQL